MDAEIPTYDPLESLDYAIAEALRNGASREDIARVVTSASLKTQPSKSRSKGYLLEIKSNEVSSRISNRAFYRFGFVLFGMLLATTNIVLSCTFLSSTTPDQQYKPATATYNETFGDNQDTTLTNSSASNIEMEDEKFDEKTTSKLRMILDHEKKDFDFHELILNVAKEDLNHSCPLDAFFHDGCRQRAGGKVCIFPNTILKKVNPSEVDAEFTSIAKLTDTRFFPKTYYADEKCRTIVVENVQPKEMRQASVCANYTFYEDFYRSAFEIFNEQNIIPRDLNVCCNTIIYDDYVRIIDFGMYKVHEAPETVREENKKLLEELLADIRKAMEKHADSCERERQKKLEREREEQKKRDPKQEEERQRQEKLEQEKEAQKQLQELQQELQRQKQEEISEETSETPPTAAPHRQW